MILLLSFNWERTVSRVPQARGSEGHGTSSHRTARLRRAWTSIFGNYAHSRRPWRGSTDRQPGGPWTPSDLSPRIYGTVHSQGGRPFRTRLRQHLLGRAFSMADLATSWASGSIWKHTVNRPLGRAQMRWHLGGIMPPSPSCCHPSPLAERHPRRRCRHAPLAEGVHRRADATGSAHVEELVGHQEPLRP